MEFEIKGKIIAALQEKSGVSSKGNAWKSREFVIEETGKEYPKKLCFRIFGTKYDELNARIEAGKCYVVKFELNASEYNGRWFNDINAYDVTLIADKPNEPLDAPKDVNPTDYPETIQKAMDTLNLEPAADTDNLPF